MVFNRQTKRLEWWGERSQLVSVLGRGIHYSCLWFRSEPIGGLGGSVWSWSSFVSWPVVVVEVMLAVSAVAVMPLQLEYKTSRLLLRLLSSIMALSSPWLWMCGPSVRDIPLCYGLGSPSCSPTRRWRVQERLYIGNGCLQRSSRQLLV